MTKKTLSKGDYHWDPFVDGITQSGLSLWLQCREQFRLSFMEGWTSKIEPQATLFGSAWHAICAEVHMGAGLQDSVVKYETAHPFSDTQEHETFYGTLGILLAAYMDQWQKENDKITWVSREERFKVEVPVAIPGVPPLVLTGMFDGLFDENKTKAFWLHEAKTKGQIDEEGIKSSLSLNFQTGYYSLAAMLKHGRTVEGVLYDVIRKPSIRRGKKETLQEFCNRLHEDIKERPGWYFMRWQCTSTISDQIAWMRKCLFPQLSEFVAWYLDVRDRKDPFDSPRHYMNPNALFTGWGRCNLFDLLTTGNTFTYKRKRSPFPELEG